MQREDSTGVRHEFTVANMETHWSHWVFFLRLLEKDEGQTKGAVEALGFLNVFLAGNLIGEFTMENSCLVLDFWNNKTEIAPRNFYSSGAIRLNWLKSQGLGKKTLHSIRGLKKNLPNSYDILICVLIDIDVYFYA